MCICVCPYAAVFKIIIFKSIFMVQKMACGLYVEDITKAKDNCQNKQGKRVVMIYMNTVSKN